MIHSIKANTALQCKTVLAPLVSFNFNNLAISVVQNIQVRNYAARKGYRKEREAKKVKHEKIKVGFLERMKKEKEELRQSRQEQLKFDDSWKRLPIDNVWIQKYYQWKLYSVKEAIECHRETHHPEMYNQPQAKLNVRIELNMEGEKKTRFLDNFHRVAAMPHKFDHGEERSILAFAKDLQIQELAREAGASLVGGTELVKEIQSGSISLADFHTIIAHPDILVELVALRGLMKKKFPNPKNGTLDPDLPAVIDKYLYGIKYSAEKNEYEKDFGLIETFIGTLDMDINHLEENFASLIGDVYKMKPKREGEFIRRCIFWSPPSSEKFKVDYTPYVQVETDKHDTPDEDDDQEIKAQTATA